MRHAKHVHRNRGHPSDMSAVSPSNLYCDAAVQPPNAVAPQPGTGPVAVVPYHATVSGQQQHIVHTIPPEFMPNDYLPVTLVVVIICSILTYTSMAISLPALLCSILVIFCIG